MLPERKNVLCLNERKRTAVQANWQMHENGTNDDWDGWLMKLQTNWAILFSRRVFGKPAKRPLGQMTPDKKPRPSARTDLALVSAVTGRNTAWLDSILVNKTRRLLAWVRSWLAKIFEVTTRTTVKHSPDSENKTNGIMSAARPCENNQNHKLRCVILLHVSLGLNVNVNTSFQARTHFRRFTGQAEFSHSTLFERLHARTEQNSFAPDAYPDFCCQSVWCLRRHDRQMYQRDAIHLEKLLGSRGFYRWQALLPQASCIVTLKRPASLFDSDQIKGVVKYGDPKWINFIRRKKKVAFEFRVFVSRLLVCTRLFIQLVDLEAGRTTWLSQDFFPENILFLGLIQWVRAVLPPCAFVLQFCEVGESLPWKNWSNVQRLCVGIDRTFTQNYAQQCSGQQGSNIALVVKMLSHEKRRSRATSKSNKPVRKTHGFKRQNIFSWTFHNGHPDQFQNQNRRVRIRRDQSSFANGKKLRKRHF